MYIPPRIPELAHMCVQPPPSYIVTSTFICTLSPIRKLIHALYSCTPPLMYVYASQTHSHMLTQHIHLCTHGHVHIYFLHPYRNAHVRKAPHHSLHRHTCTHQPASLRHSNACLYPAHIITRSPHLHTHIHTYTLFHMHIPLHCPCTHTSTYTPLYLYRYPPLHTSGSSPNLSYTHIHAYTALPHTCTYRPLTHTLTLTQRPIHHHHHIPYPHRHTLSYTAALAVCQDHLSPLKLPCGAPRLPSSYPESTAQHFPWHAEPLGAAGIGAQPLPGEVGVGAAP